MLSHLVYVSTRKPSCTSGEIEKILDSCKKNNSNMNITGVLLYSDAKFIQYLEGDSKEIIGLYDKIKGDNRHEKAIMISYGPIKEKTFPSWHMATKQVSQKDVEFRTDITSQDKEIFRHVLNGNEQEGTKVLALLKKFFS